MGLEKSMSYPFLRSMDESVDTAIPGRQTPMRSLEADELEWERAGSKRKQTAGGTDRKRLSRGH